MKRKDENKVAKYIYHPLNISKSKSTHSFRKSQRFIPEKSFSPNKFYDIPSTLSHRASSIGIGKKIKIENKSFVEPNRYQISSDFDKMGERKPSFTTFGINREEYYKGKFSNNIVGPGAYNVQDILQSTNRKSIYIGNRIESQKLKHTISSATYEVKDEIFNKLKKSCRIKTEYYPKKILQEYNNKTPGPGSYDLSYSNYPKQKISNFGKEERIKLEKPSKLGPGSYNNFSQFGIA